MKTSKKGIDLIKLFEGCKLTSYQCSAKVWTIGYGHTQGVTKGMVITQLQADNFLKKDLIQFENQINSLDLPINQNQFDALVSLVYNIGFGNLKRSMLVAMIKINPKNANIKTEWNKFVFAGGVKLLGLIRRRSAEFALYNTI